MFSFLSHEHLRILCQKKFLSEEGTKEDLIKRLTETIESDEESEELSNVENEDDVDEIKTFSIPIPEIKNDCTSTTKKSNTIQESSLNIEESDDVLKILKKKVDELIQENQNLKKQNEYLNLEIEKRPTIEQVKELIGKQMKSLKKKKFQTITTFEDERKSNKKLSLEKSTSKGASPSIKNENSPVEDDKITFKTKNLSIEKISTKSMSPINDKKIEKKNTKIKLLQYLNKPQPTNEKKINIKPTKEKKEIILKRKSDITIQNIYDTLLKNLNSQSGNIQNTNLKETLINLNTVIREIDYLTQITDNELKENIQMKNISINLKLFKEKILNKPNIDYEVIKSNLQELKNKIESFVKTEEDLSNYYSENLSDYSFEDEFIVKNPIIVQIHYDYKNKKFKVKIEEVEETFFNKTDYKEDNFIELPEEMFQIKTNELLSLNKITEKSNLLLIFITDIEFISTKKLLNDIFDNYPNIIKTGTIPVIVHMESEMFISHYFNANIDLNKFNILPRIDDSDHYLRNLFKIKNDENLIVTQNNYSLSEKKLNKVYKKDVISNALVSAFYIEENKIINEFRSKKLDSFPDLMRLIINPEYSWIKKSDQNLNSSYCIDEKTYTQIKKDDNVKKSIFGLKFKMKEENKKEETFSGSFIPLKNVSDDLKDISLKDMIYHSKIRQYFKLYLSKEYCLENMMFIEQVQIFKNIQDSEKRFQYSKDIYEEFFLSNSINEVFN
jgi:hypothetical protein